MFDGFGVPFVSDNANVPIFSPDAIEGKIFSFDLQNHSF